MGYRPDQRKHPADQCPSEKKVQCEDRACVAFIPAEIGRQEVNEQTKPDEKQT